MSNDSLYLKYLKEYQTKSIDELGTKWGDATVPNSGADIDFSKSFEDDDLENFKEKFNAIFPE